MNQCRMFDGDNEYDVHQNYYNFLKNNNVEIVATTLSMAYRNVHTFKVVLIVTYKEI